MHLGLVLFISLTRFHCHALSFLLGCDTITLSLRQQLANTPVSIVEIIPPAVNTDLGGVGLHTFGAPLDEFADAVFARLGAGDLEIAYGFAAESSQASRAELDAIFTRMNASTH